MLAWFNYLRESNWCLILTSQFAINWWSTSWFYCRAVLFVSGAHILGDPLIVVDLLHNLTRVHSFWTADEQLILIGHFCLLLSGVLIFLPTACYFSCVFLPFRPAYYFLLAATSCWPRIFSGTRLICRFHYYFRRHHFNCTAYLGRSYCHFWRARFLRSRAYSCWSAYN